MITYILEIKINGKIVKTWRSWNLSALIKKTNKLKLCIPTYVRGYASPDLEEEIRYHAGKLTSGTVIIKIYEKNKKFAYTECIIDNKGDIIKDDNNCY